MSQTENSWSGVVGEKPEADSRDNAWLLVKKLTGQG